MAEFTVQPQFYPENTIPTCYQDKGVEKKNKFCTHLHNISTLYIIIVWRFLQVHFWQNSKSY